MAAVIHQMMINWWRRVLYLGIYPDGWCRRAHLRHFKELIQVSESQWCSDALQILAP